MIADSFKQALLYASKGWHVFPLQGKLPLKGSRGLLDATTDKTLIRDWFQKSDYNIGVRTGKVSNLTVVDIDCHGEVDGNESWNLLTKSYGDVRTLHAKTAGGGNHLYFNYLPDSTNRAGILPGIDVRSDGGYVVAPGSKIGTQKYQWLERVKPAPVPVWLAELIVITKAHDEAAVTEEQIPVGKRNDTLFRIICGMRYQNVPEKIARKFAKIYVEDCAGDMSVGEALFVVSNVYNRYQPFFFKKPAKCVECKIR